MNDNKQPIAAGKSSFDLVEAEKLFDRLALKPGMVFLDLACGRGSYTLRAAERLAGSGVVHGVDLWEDGIKALSESVAAKKLTNVRPLHADAKSLPLEPASVDLCLLATVLHDFVEEGSDGPVLRELCRVMKPGGTVAVVEFKKIAGPPGPPIHIRLNPEEVAERLAPFGFVVREAEVEVGPYHYLSTFVAPA